ncbi:FKBP-type peptidyl-prolyl cis-trans isomerase [Candidatus Woesearchaeota archaeon]|nr:FKBP-type peptidyl-prolyl cis-trans isomerase [Candidatus Woesearchaeota archaeon]MBW3018009.1 FKBP-type peptidyl-prolyl cis-trans isomerase [Candidatus Woesearchaeota archaeon]
MAETIKKGDFVEIEYTGEVEGKLFDTTDEKKAKESGVYNQSTQYGSVIVCIGEGHLLEGLEEFLEGKEIGKEYTVKLQPEQAFGKKQAQLIKLIPKNKFTSQNINPMPGMQLNIDGMIATIKSISGGRVLVDYNHPLSGKEVDYKIKANKKITDMAEKLHAVIYMETHFKKDNYQLEVKENKAIISFKTESSPVADEMKTIIEKIKQPLIEKLKSTTGIKEVEIK